MAACAEKNALWGKNLEASGSKLSEAPPARDFAVESESYGYETAMGRACWPSRDRIEEQGGLNLYGMVGNMPVNYNDVLGNEIFFAIYYSNKEFDPGESFKRAAETWQLHLTFNPSCDRFLLKPVRTKSDFIRAWNEIKEAIEAEKKNNPAHYKAKQGIIFTHGGWSTLFLAGTEANENYITLEANRHLSTGAITTLPKLDWSVDGKIDIQSCHSASCEPGKIAVIDAFAKDQQVPVTGQTGFADFSESPEAYIEIDKTGVGTSTGIYLKAWDKWSWKHRDHPNVGWWKRFYHWDLPRPFPTRTANP